MDLITTVVRVSRGKGRLLEFSILQGAIDIPRKKVRSSTLAKKTPRSAGSTQQTATRRKASTKSMKANTAKSMKANTAKSMKANTAKSMKANTAKSMKANTAKSMKAKPVAVSASTKAKSTTKSKPFKKAKSAKKNVKLRSTRSRIGIRDRLGQLTYRAACRLMGDEDIAVRLQQGAKFEINIAEDVFLGGDTLRVSGTTTRDRHYQRDDQST